ncbi:Tf2-9, partial [Mucuna pruriens]
MNYVKKCDKCQRFTEGHKAPPKRLHSVTSPWPFYKWRIDILGPFPITPGQVKFLIVAIDYFTKWIEAESTSIISSKRIRSFLWKRIICRFGIPAELVSDNGTQFESCVTTEFYEGLKIKQLFALVEHPQSNGLAVAANKVLWSYHTTPHSTTNETPFRLTFGTKVMIPVEIGEPSPRTALFAPGENEDELRENLDMLQEIREIAHVREYAVKARVARKYDQTVIPRSFKLHELVLRKITQRAYSNKLPPIWEGPFRVIEEVGRGAYYLECLDGKKVSRTWKATALQIYYS